MKNEYMVGDVITYRFDDGEVLAVIVNVSVNYIQFAIQTTDNEYSSLYRVCHNEFDETVRITRHGFNVFNMIKREITIKAMFGS